MSFQLQASNFSAFTFQIFLLHFPNLKKNFSNFRYYLSNFPQLSTFTLHFSAGNVFLVIFSSLFLAPAPFIVETPFKHQNLRLHWELMMGITFLAICLEKIFSVLLAIFPTEIKRWNVHRLELVTSEPECEKVENV